MTNERTATEMGDLDLLDLLRDYVQQHNDLLSKADVLRPVLEKRVKTTHVSMGEKYFRVNPGRYSFDLLDVSEIVVLG